MGKLAVFEVFIDGMVCKFSIYGDYEISTGMTISDYVFQYPSFNNLLAYKIIDGKEMAYHPTGENWIGREYDVSDMLEGFLTSLIRNDSSYTLCYLCEPLMILVDEYLSDKNVACIVNNLKIPKYILGNNMYDCFYLEMVTERFIYYICDDNVLMLSTDTHSIVSDNYFAEVGYWDSVEDIEKGCEALIYGTLPDSDGSQCVYN